MVEKKAGKTEFTIRTPERLEGVNQDGSFLVVRESNVLRGLEGAEPIPR
jgi:hypothetical protein